MKPAIIKLSIAAFTFLLSINISAQEEFQGKAYYFSKTTMDMSRWNRGGQMSEAQKKQMAARMKPWLEKTYILTFSKEESMFIEDEKLAGPVSGRAPSVWGSSFSAGPQYKNVKTKIFLQDQEFFGKQFLIKEEMKPLDWKMGTEMKQIGQYTCFKATASRPSSEVNWTRTNRRRDADKDDKAKKTDSTKTGDIVKVEEEVKEEEIEMVEIVAWYTLSIPVNQGPSEYWGLPGLILEVSAGNTTMLCSKIIMNPEEKTKIEAPTKGQVVTKKEYNEIITGKMQEMRDNRGRGSGRSGR
jgi:GLPGLI family protein